MKNLNIIFTFEIDYFADLEQYYAPEDLPTDFDIEKAVNGDEIYDVERYGKMKVGYTVQADDCWFSILTDGRPWSQETIFNRVFSDLELVHIDDGFWEIVMPDGNILHQDDVYDVYWLHENKLLDIDWNFSD